MLFDIEMLIIELKCIFIDIKSLKAHILFPLSIPLSVVKGDNMLQYVKNMPPNDTSKCKQHDKKMKLTAVLFRFLLFGH